MTDSKSSDICDGVEDSSVYDCAYANEPAVVTIIDPEVPMVAIRCADKPFKTPPSPSKMLEQLQGKGYYSFFPNESWTPNVNLYETEAAYFVCVDLAGVEKNKIEIEVVQGRLRLRGNRAVPTIAPTADTQQTRIRMHLMEIDHGPFARDVELPENVHHEQINARYHDGMLWIELPKKN